MLQVKSKAKAAEVGITNRLYWNQGGLHEGRLALSTG